MAMQKTATFLKAYETQKQSGHDPDLADEFREQVEDEVAKEDHRLFYGKNEAGEALRKPLGRMLRDRPNDYEEKVREGAKGTRG
jgi:hypothetical protein